MSVMGLFYPSVDFCDIVTYIKPSLSGNKEVKMSGSATYSRNIILFTRAGRHRVQVSAPFFLAVFLILVALVQRMRYANAEPTFLKA